MKALGLDIGSSSVKAVLLSKGLFGLHLLDARDVPTGGSDPSEAIRTCVSQLSDNPTTIVVSLDRRELATRFVELPTRDHLKIRKLAPFQMQEKIPFASEALIDGCPIASSGERGSWALLCAIREVDFDGRMNLVREALGRDSLSYHVDALSSLNVLLAFDPPGEATVLFLDIGASKTAVTVLGQSRVLGSRMLLAGMANEPDDATAQAFADGLVPELKRSLLSCGVSGGGVSSIVVTGGGALSPALQERLAALFGCHVRPLAPPLLKGLSTKFSTALGLALTPLVRQPIPLDFHYGSRPHFLLEPSNLLLAGGFALLLALYYAGGLYLERNALHAAKDLLTEQIGKLETEVYEGPMGPARGGDTSECLARIRTRIGLLQRNTLSPVRTLHEATARLGSEPVTLTGFNLQTDRVTIEAETDSFQTADRVKLSLSRSPFFTDIKYENVHNVGPVSRKKLRFNLVFRLRHVDEGKGGG